MWLARSHEHATRANLACVTRRLERGLVVYEHLDRAAIFAMEACAARRHLRACGNGGDRRIEQDATTRADTRQIRSPHVKLVRTGGPAGASDPSVETVGTLHRPTND